MQKAVGMVLVSIGVILLTYTLALRVFNLSRILIAPTNAEYELASAGVAFLAAAYFVFGGTL